MAHLRPLDECVVGRNRAGFEASRFGNFELDQSLLMIAS
jgi:hypothetical protein